MKFLKMYVLLLIIISNTGFSFSTENLSEPEKRRKELNERFDKLKLRRGKDFVVDCSREFLNAPEDKPSFGEYTVAGTPPTVRMMILPDMVPEYFPEGEAYMVAWANWAHMTRSEDNRFFFSVGDHRGFGCQINLYEYSPARNIVHKVLDVDELLGWTKQSYTDGKIHGKMGIMPDGTLWATTHFGVPPDSSWFANGYRGSWLFSYNIYTHEAKNWGIPLIGNNLPCFNLDSKRGIFLGTGAYFTVLCWDCINNKVRYGGFPPDGWIWWRRAMLVDMKTGKFWGQDDDNDKGRFMSFDPEFNKFERYEISPPINPYTNKRSHLRAHTDRPAMDEWYYWSTMNGALFKFKPEGPNGPLVEYVNVNWDKGRDVLQFAMEPNGRYIYYLVVGNKGQDAPLIQFDVKTGARKVLCWLREYYFKKYGYWVGGTYGLEITRDGTSLVICMNGAFQGRDISYGHPSLFVVDIPESERLHDR